MERAVAIGGRTRDEPPTRKAAKWDSVDDVILYEEMQHPIRAHLTGLGSVRGGAAGVTHGPLYDSSSPGIPSSMWVGPSGLLRNATTSGQQPTA